MSLLMELFQEMLEGTANELTKCIHFLYDNDVLVEDIILRWHKGLQNDSPAKSKVLAKLLTSFFLLKMIHLTNERNSLHAGRSSH